jgi:hypothetical protein
MQENEVSHLPFQDSFDDTVYFMTQMNEEGVEASDEVEVPCCEIEDEEAVP